MPTVYTSACLRDGVNVSQNEKERKRIIPAAQPMSPSPPSPPLAEDWLFSRITFIYLNFYFIFFSCTILFKKNCTLKEKGKNEQVAVATC